MVDAAGFAADSVATILYPNDAPVNQKVYCVTVLGVSTVCTGRLASDAVFGRSEHPNVRANVVQELLENVRYMLSYLLKGLSRQMVMMNTTHSGAAVLSQVLGNDRSTCRFFE